MTSISEDIASLTADARPRRRFEFLYRYAAVGVIVLVTIVFGLVEKFSVRLRWMLSHHQETTCSPGLPCCGHPPQPGYEALRLLWHSADEVCTLPHRSALVSKTLSQR